MRKNARLVFCFVYMAILLISCDQNQPVGPIDNLTSEYQILYSPVDLGYLEFARFNVNTSTNEMEDTVVFSDDYLVRSADISSDGNYVLFSGHHENDILKRKLWIEDYSNGNEIYSAYYPGSSDILGPVLNESKNLLATVGDGNITIWDFPTMTRVCKIPTIKTTAFEYRFYSSPNKIIYFDKISGGTDTLRVADFSDPLNVIIQSYVVGASTGGHFELVEVDMIAQELILAKDNGWIYQLRLSDFQPIDSINSGEKYQDIQASIDGSRVFLCFGAGSIWSTDPNDNRIDLFDMTNNSITKFLANGDIDLATFSPQQMFLSPDNKILFVVSDMGSDGAVLGFDLSTYDEVFRLNPEHGLAYGVAISPIDYGKK